MTEWEPATDAEIAMRNALRTDDQESYFRILAGVDLLLPVSADALAGLAPLGWGTWSTGGRTHVLAFTSPSALQACLADYTGSARRVAYAELADTWPNLEWWLAVNPGLPIEGYLPAWFVAQLSRGDLRLPTRGPGREGSNAPNRIQDLHAAATLAATAAAQGYNAAAQSYAAPASGGPIPGSPAPSGAASGAAVSSGPAYGAPGPGGGSAYSRPGSGGPGSGGPGTGGPGTDGPGSGGPGSGAPAYGSPGSGAPAYGGAVPSGAAATGTAGSGPAAPAGSRGPAPLAGSAASAASGYAGSPPDRRHPGDSAAGRPGAGLGGRLPESSGLGGRLPESSPADAGSGSPVGPGGLPLRTPGAVLPSGLPSRVPGTPAGQGGGIPGGQFNGFGTSSGGRPAQPADQPEDRGRPGGPAQDPRGFAGEPGGSSTRPGGSPAQPGGPQSQPGGVQTPQGQRGGPQTPQGQPGGLQTPQGLAGGGMRPSVGAGSDVPAAYKPPTLPPGEPAARSAAGSSALSALGSRTAGAAASGPAQLQRPDAPLPTRTPMAQTPPLPAHIPPPPDTDDVPRTGDDQDDATGSGVTDAKGQDDDQSATTDRTPRSQESATSTRPGLAPPVIPGAGGAGRGATSPTVPAPASRPTIPPAPSTPADQSPGAAPTRPGPAPTSPGPSDSRLTGAETPDSGTADADTPDSRTTGSGTADRRPDFDDDFVPANEVERDLYHAVDEGSTDSFLSTLLLATVLVPVAPNSRPGSAPGESGFAFRTEEIDSDRFLVVFTSRDRLSEHFAEPTRTVGVRFVDLIRNWPDPAWSFAVNPTSPIGAKYPGPQVIALATWAVEAGLGGDPVDAPVAQPQRPAETTAQLTVMQKAVPAEQIDYYLERGYDRVAGFVHRSGEVEHLRSPGDLFAALGLLYDGSPYQGDAKEAFVLRWPAHRPSLYRIPYGGQSEQALRAMDGWVIERPPFRGNGFAPGEGKDVIAEFKVDSVRLPHGAELWRMDADGAEQMIAVFDCDAPVWRRVGEQ